MSPPLFAGFEAAVPAWNRHCTLTATGHLPEARMAEHYRHALACGARGFRDCLPERFDPVARIETARAEVGDAPIVWSLVHWDRPRDYVAHARRIARLMGPHDRLLAFVEPSVGPAVCGRTQLEATALAAAMMAAALDANPAVRWWTCDPMHGTGPHEYAATDALVALFGPVIEAIGVNYHAQHAACHLRGVLRATAARYPDHRIALAETSWHDGHHEAEARWPDIRSRAAWWRRVQVEIAASRVPLAAACWFPFVDMAFEAGARWPNGWPAAS